MFKFRKIREYLWYLWLDEFKYEELRYYTKGFVANYSMVVAQNVVALPKYLCWFSLAGRRVGIRWRFIYTFHNLCLYTLPIYRVARDVCGKPQTSRANIVCYKIASSMAMWKFWGFFGGERHQKSPKFPPPPQNFPSFSLPNDEFPLRFPQFEFLDLFIPQFWYFFQRDFSINIYLIYVYFKIPYC